MGLPLIGETLEFFARSPSLDLLPFFKRRMERYGPIFKTNLVGKDLIVSLDPDVNHYVLQQEEKAFHIWFPDSFMKLLGEENIARCYGSLHKNTRNLIRRVFGPENLRLVLLHDMQGAVERCLSSWHDRPSIELKPALSSMIFGIAAKWMIGYEASVLSGDLWKNFDVFNQGLLSFPLNIPGTAFYKCMQGRNNVMKTLKEVLDERRKKAETPDRMDFIDVIVSELNKQNPALSENLALNVLFLLIFASFETTSSGLTAALKFLSDNPKALKELEDLTEPIGGSKDFIAFGSGLRLCVGVDFARLQMSVFLHFLVTKYRLKVISGGDMVFGPGLGFPNGFQVQLETKK
nr:unnamed protein product [Digitaria exilis]